VLVYSFVHVAELFVRNMLWPAAGDNTFRDFERSYEIGFLAFVWPGLALGFASLASSDRARRNLFGIAVLVPIVALCVTVYVFKSEIRFRIPFDPLLCVVACCGWMAGARLVRSVYITFKRARPRSS